MTDVAIAAAMVQHLVAINPDMLTVVENTEPEWEAGPLEPFQQVYFLPAEPANDEMGPSYTELGVMHVNLCFPRKDGPGPGDAWTAAQAIRMAFKRTTTLDAAGGLKVKIDKTPAREAGQDDGDRYVVPVKVRYAAYVAL